MRPKNSLDKLIETEVAWETLAPTAVFYGINIADYKLKVRLSRDIREMIATLEEQLNAAIVQRNTLDAEHLALEKLIAKGIAGDENFGDDSALYEGTGRVRKSERRSGLTHKKKVAGKDD